jgi:hypothetical protein
LGALRKELKLSEACLRPVLSALLGGEFLAKERPAPEPDQSGDALSGIFYVSAPQLKNR